MHDINLIYSQYLVDKVLEERRERASNNRRAQEAAARAPLVSRVVAILRLQRPGEQVAASPMTIAAKAEGTSS